MKKLKDFSEWIISKESPYGGGSREKNWIENPKTGKKGLFKYPKFNPGENSITGEYWAEDLAVEIAKEVGIECADVEIGIFNGKIGSISYLLTGENENLIEGIQYITQKYPCYDQDKFIDTETNKPYSIAMILNSLIETPFKKRFLEIPIFDCLIGNTDRHSSNWGIIKDYSKGTERFSPLYDNGSSLMCYENEKDILNILKDNNRFIAKADRKSLSIIRWKLNKRPTHLELISFLKQNYYEETYEVVSNIVKINEDKIETILDKYPDSIISNNRKELIKRFLLYKISKMQEIYN